MPALTDSLTGSQPATFADGPGSRGDPALGVSLALGSVLFLVMLPVTMMVPVLKEIVSERFQAGVIAAHLFMSINMVGAIVTAPFTASLADRAHLRKNVLMAALGLNAATLLFMPLAGSFSLFLVLRFFEGAFHVLAISTLMAAASDWATGSRRGRQMGMIGAALVFGTACGAPLGGRIGQLAPMAVFLLGFGAVLIAMGMCLVGVREAPTRSRPARLADTLELVRSKRVLLVPYAFSFIDRFCVGVIISSFVLFLGDVHAFSPSQRGGLLALFLFPFALLCYPAGRLADRFGRSILMIVGNAAFGLAFAAYGLVPAAWLPMLMVVSGVCSAALFAPNLALCADIAPQERRAAAFAGFNMAGSLGFLSGPLGGAAVHALVAGWRGSTAAYISTFCAAGLSVLLCAILLAPSLRRLDR